MTIIRPGNWLDHLNPVIDGERKSRGLVQRDHSKHPVGCFAGESEFPDNMLIPEDEWSDRLKEQQDNKATLLDLRNNVAPALDSLDQDGVGICWCFSTTKALMYVRAIQGETKIKLSAWALAGWLNNWKDEGGFGAHSLAEAVKVGIPEYDLCPSYDRKYDTPELKANAANNRVTEFWSGSDDPKKRVQQGISALLLGFPLITDWSAWGHSTCSIGVKSITKPIPWVVDNSWGSKAGANGIYYKTDENPCDISIPRVGTASNK